MSEDTKRAVGIAGAALVENGMRLGLGTGSTVAHVLDALAARGLDVAGVPTSEATAARCRQLGIRLLDPEDVDELDLAIDGADELDHGLSATKGGGGALLREKVVASMAATFVVVATLDKLVQRLGATFALPIEVVPFATAPVTRRLQAEGFEVTLRQVDRGRPVVTDNGNHILDARRPQGIEDTAATDVLVSLIPGVVACGLFVDLVDRALLARPDGSIQTLSRQD